MLRLPVSSAASCLVACVVPFVAPTAALAQCPFDWLPGQGLPGIHGTVRAFTHWDPDGQGPAPPLLVAGGGFQIAGDTIANSIVAWDGMTWQVLGSWPGGPGGGTNGDVHALAVYNGELIAGGDFTTAGGMSASRIARWDGSSWQTLGSGLSAEVYALTVYNGELIAGGFFTSAGGASANRIARWNGSSWQALGSGTGYLGVYALGVVSARESTSMATAAAGGFRRRYCRHA